VANPDPEVKSSGRVHNAASYVQLDLTSVSAFAPVSHDRDCEEDCLLGCKGKAIPLQAWTGPEGSRSLRLPDFRTIGT
jgi:hypothetical protein